MGSENAGVCTHSSSSHLDDLLHQHFLYDVSLHFLDSKMLLNNLLELSNYPVIQARVAITSSAVTAILDSRIGSLVKTPLPVYPYASRQLFHDTIVLQNIDIGTWYTL